MNKEIQLAKGKGIVLVDDADYGLVSKHQWSLVAGYAAATLPRVNGRHGKSIYMHRLIMGAKPNRLIMGAKPSQKIDHINGNKLDNTRANLRFCLHHENIANSNKKSNNTSGYKGVSWHKQRKKWQAKIKVNYRSHHLGLFANPADAAIAYNIAALKHFGEFAKLNLIPPGQAI